MKIDFSKIETGEIGNFLNALHPLVESNKESLLIQLLVCYGNCIGRTVFFSAAEDKHYSNLFVALVGKSARGRKGQSLNMIKELFKHVDLTWYQNCIKKGLSSGEGLIYHIRDEKIIDATAGVEINIGGLDKRLLCTESEFSSVLKNGQRDGNILSQILRDAWDGSKMETMTKVNPIKATEPMISVIGHITISELTRYLKQTEIDNGFANRFIFIKAERDKTLPNPEPIDEAVKKYLSGLIKISIINAKKITKINFDKKALDYWIQFYEKTCHDDPSFVGTLTARQAAQVRRLSMIIALFNNKSEIDFDSLIFAEKIYDYSIETLKEIYGNSMGDNLTDRICDILQGHPDGISRSKLSDLISNNYEKSRIDRSLKILKSNELADFKKIETTGRPSEKWYWIEKIQKEYQYEK